jgi:putative ABC transport system substrate-binding protein
MIRRRDFITLLGGTAAWPLAARAQQRAMPLVGYLSPGTPEAGAHNLAAFREGLSETGFVEGRNVAIEYRFANNVNDRLPQLAADLVSRRITALVASSLQAALAAKAATATIPIVFRTGADPIQSGLVANFNKPGGNITGINDIGMDLGAKRLGLLRDLLPTASRFAILIDPTAPYTESSVTQAQVAASTIARPIEVVTASTSREIDSAFARLAQRTDALLVNSDALFFDRRVHVVSLAMYHRLPAIYAQREFADAGGLVSYGPNLADQHRQAGIYAGRILKGEKPVDLPVLRPVKFEFVINLQTARTLGITVPPTLLAIADEVID